MQYLCLIYSDENAGSTRSEAENAAYMGAYFKFTTDIKESGNHVGGEALLPTSAATTVRVRDGKTLLTDGPFAETKEQLGGFYLVEAKDLDEAVSIAARIPTAAHGCVEVRPIMTFN